jgi:hypothetical protein
MWPRSIEIGLLFVTLASVLKEHLIHALVFLAFFLTLVAVFLIALAVSETVIIIFLLLFFFVFFVALFVNVAIGCGFVVLEECGVKFEEGAT